IELDDVDVADHLRDVGLDVGRLGRRRAAAAGEIAGHEVVEVVVLDERADALRVEIAVGDGDLAAAEEVAAGGDEGRAHAAAEIEHRPGDRGLPGYAGVGGCGDVVEIRAARARRRGRRARRLNGRIVAVVEGGAGDAAGVHRL